MARTVVSIMQPYFAPYPGYYRLLAAADLFVIYDCVQFPRRGWVHRNRLPDAKGEPAWLTLPLEAAAYDAPISSLVFASDAPRRMAERVRSFPSMTRPGPAAEAFLAPSPFVGGLVDYLEKQLHAAQHFFMLQCNMVRSSTLGIDPQLRAQDRILAILEAVGASDYVNAPGGRELYDESAFAQRGVRLHFLPDWQGSYWSTLHHLATEPAGTIRDEILAQTPDYSAA